MSDPIVHLLTLFVAAVQPFFLLYFVLYNSYTLWLIALSARPVRRRVVGHFIEELDRIGAEDLTKPVTIILPARNEETSILENVTRLLNCDYPRFEVVVVTDGSADSTLERLKHGFQLRRTDVPYRPAIATAPVRALYRGTTDLPPGVLRLIVIDKENRGKADARNAGINASTTPYVVSLDTCSIPDQRALKKLMRVIQKDPRVIAVGGQVAIANGCMIHNGQVMSVGLPVGTLPRFQMVEYLRSTVARTGLDRVHATLKLSGIVVFQKEMVIRAGGYQTPFLRDRLSKEYGGRRVGTVGQDMEIIVRLHRFVLDKLHDRRIAFLPHTVAWTEVPETFESLRKQRGRWYRGLRESLRNHRAMLGRAKFGPIGWFALPALWLFEYYGPVIEVAGYLLILFSLLMEWVLEQHFISYEYLLGFLLASFGYGVLVNVLAMLVGAWPFRYGLADRLHGGLLPFNRRREVLILLLYAVLENFGYRQLTLYWRLRGLWDAWRGTTGRRKSGRVGFYPGDIPVHG